MRRKHDGDEMLAAALILAAFLTAILSGVLGMAGGLLLMGLAAWLLPVADAMVFHGVTQLASNGSRALVLRRHVRWSIVAWHALGSALAFGAVTLVALRPDRATLLIGLGLVPFVARLLPRSLKLDASRPRSAVACGFATGAVQLLAGVAGPLLDAWFVDAPLDRREVVATKAATQALSHSMKIARFVPLLASGTELHPALLAGTAVAALLGTSVGTRLLEKLSEARFRSITRQVVLAIGAAYLVQGAWIALAP